MIKFSLISSIINQQLLEDEPERARGDSTTSDSSKLADIVSELMLPTSADTRFVLYLTATELKAHYLKSGGGVSAIDLMDDTELTELARKSKDKSRLVEFGKTFKFSELITPPSSFSTAERAVVIDVPGSITSAIENTGRRAASALSDTAALEAFKTELKKAMSHKLYVLTLNIPKSKKIAAEMDTKSGTDEWVEVFDPSVIENYPIKQILVSAKNEWDREHSQLGKRVKDVTKLERDAALSQREREASKKLSGNIELEKKLVNAIIANGGKTEAEIAGKIKDGLAAAHEQADVVTSLNKLSTDYGQPKFADIAKEVGKITAWR